MLTGLSWAVTPPFLVLISEVSIVFCAVFSWLFEFAVLLLPMQAVQIISCRLKPCDKGEKWTPQVRATQHWCRASSWCTFQSFVLFASSRVHYFQECAIAMTHRSAEFPHYIILNKMTSSVGSASTASMVLAQFPSSCKDDMKGNDGVLPSRLPVQKLHTLGDH